MPEVGPRLVAGEVGHVTIVARIGATLVEVGVDVTEGLGRGLDALVVQARDRIGIAAGIVVALLVRLGEGLGSLDRKSHV